MVDCFCFFLSSNSRRKLYLFGVIININEVISGLSHLLSKTTLLTTSISVLGDVMYYVIADIGMVPTVFLFFFFFFEFSSTAQCVWSSREIHSWCPCHLIYFIIINYFFYYQDSYELRYQDLWSFQRGEAKKYVEMSWVLAHIMPIWDDTFLWNYKY